ncbi:hypothetical protein KI387_002312, partial [Taxus chinensis]
PVMMLLYPLYASIREIENPSQVDDQQWLTYWVLYSLIALFELSFYRALAWFPIWPYIKLIASFWLVLPMFNGAAYIYENYVRKFALDHVQTSSKPPPGQKQVFQKMSPAARVSVENYIAKHGEKSFERVIKAAEKEAKKKKAVHH